MYRIKNWIEGGPKLFDILVTELYFMFVLQMIWFLCNGARIFFRWICGEFEDFPGWFAFICSFSLNELNSWVRWSQQVGFKPPPLPPFSSDDGMGAVIIPLEFEGIRFDFSEWHRDKDIQMGVIFSKRFVFRIGLERANHKRNNWFKKYLGTST